MKASVNIKMDTELRDKAKELFGQMGLDMTTAVNLFLIAAVREKGLPFAVTTVPEHDIERMFDEYISAKLARAESQVDRGEYRAFSDVMTEMKQKYGLE